MPTTSTLVAFWPRMPWSNRKLRTGPWSSAASALFGERDRLGRRRRTSASWRAARRSRRDRCRRPWPSPSLARLAALPACPLISADRLVPGADERLAEIRVVLQRLGVDHHEVDDLAGDLRGIEHLRWPPGIVEDLGDQRIPGHDGRRRRCVLVGGDHVGVGGVDDLDVLLLQLRPSRARAPAGSATPRVRRG